MKTKKSKKRLIQEKADKMFQTWFMEQEENQKCESCGAPAVCGHHYFPKSIASELRYDPDNMIPICQKCHNKIHGTRCSIDPNISKRILEKRGFKWNDELEEKRRNKTIKTSIGYYQGIIKHYEQNIGQKIYYNLTN